MSVTAMSWALKQRLWSPLAQGLLYVIADSADPDGLTRYCDPTYMEDHARLTRSTMFRMLGEMESRGILKRQKYYSERGDVRYEIILNFGAMIDEPIRRRRKSADTANSDDDSDETQDEEMNATPESHCETLESSDQSLTGAGPKSQSCDYHNDGPSLSKKESHPYPSPRGFSKGEALQAEKRNELWSKFEAGYPGIAVMDKRVALEEFDALSIDDAEWATSVLPQLKAELAKLGNRPPKNAHLWLRKRQFENFPKRPIVEPAPAETWIVEGSDEDRALRMVRGLCRLVTPLVRAKPGGGPNGYPHPSPVGLDLLAMLVVADVSRLKWPGVEIGTQECGAWRQRVWQWVGGELRPDPGERFIRVPWPFPASKDGIIYEDSPETQGDAHEALWAEPDPQSTTS